MVGRADERRALLVAWERVSTGGRVVVVEGEPGIGKTRLVDELAAQVRSRGGRS
jgi:predicted ATPase